MSVLVSTEAGEEEKRISRRRLLKTALVFSAIGGGLIILGGTSRFATKANAICDCRHPDASRHRVECQPGAVTGASPSNVFGERFEQRLRRVGQGEGDVFSDAPDCRCQRGVLRSPGSGLLPRPFVQRPRKTPCSLTDDADHDDLDRRRSCDARYGAGKRRRG